jgi:hypothetical protein
MNDVAPLASRPASEPMLPRALSQRGVVHDASARLPLVNTLTRPRALPLMLAPLTVTKPRSRVSTS